MDINTAGEMRPGAQMDSNIHLLYDGDRDYYISFDNFSEEVELELPIKK